MEPYSWFQIPMCESFTVHRLQAFRDLKDNKASLILGQRFDNASVQIAEL